MHCLSHLLRLFVTLICNPRVLRQGFTTPPYNYLGSQTLTFNYSGWNIRRDKLFAKPQRDISHAVDMTSTMKT